MLPSWMTGMGEGWLPHLGWVSFYGGASIAGAWLICRGLERLPPVVRDWFWRIVYVKLILLLIWPMAIHIPLVPRPAVRVERTATPTNPTPAYAPEFCDLAAGEIVPREFETQVASPPEISTPAFHSRPGGGFFALVLMGLWLAGVCCFGWGTICRILATRSLLRDAMPMTKPALLRDYDVLRSQLVPRRAVPLQCHAGVNGAQTVGVLRPVILIPPAFLGAFPAHELRMMLAHELAHIRRHDLVWRWLRHVVQGILFFHPLMWLADRRATLAEELACDELALEFAPATPANYATTLLRAAAQSLQGRFSDSAFVSAGMSRVGRELHRRLRALAWIGDRQGEILRRTRCRATVAGVLGLALFLPCGLVSWMHSPGIEQIDPAQRVLGYQVSRGKAHALEVRHESCRFAGLKLSRTDTAMTPKAGGHSSIAWSSNAEPGGGPGRVGSWLRAIGLRPDIMEERHGITLNFTTDSWVFLVRFVQEGPGNLEQQIEALLLDEDGETVPLEPHPVNHLRKSGEHLRLWILSPAPITPARFDLLLRSIPNGNEIALLRLGEL